MSSLKPPQKEVKALKPPKRCQHKSCKKKLSLVEKTISCKCKKYFCRLHRFPEEHECSFDFRADDKEKLEKTLLNCKIVNSCMDKL